ncbi:MAG: DnaJ domain-containing protein [Pseudomonadota bacterium]
MIYLFLPLIVGIAGVFLVPALLRWIAHADPARLARMARLVSGVGVLALAGGFGATGLLMAAAPLAMMGLYLIRGGRMPGFSSVGAKPRAGQKSVVRTARFEASLDHDSGDMDAVILVGRYEGQRFSALSDEALVELWRECGGDSESRSIAEAYLDRRFPDWREHVEADEDIGAGSAGGAGGGGAMTEQDAYELLGLQPGASEAEIRASHRRLMKQMHPDQGGSTFFAAKLNEAKDLLLRRR